MEAELQAAVLEYRTQLHDLAQLLAADPDNQELKEVYGQLQEALDYTLSALGGQDEAQQLQGGQEQQGEAGGAEGSAGAHAGAASAGHGGGGLPRAAAPGSNNSRMHPANRYYRAEPDFAALAEQYEELRPYVTTGPGNRGKLDTTSWEATRALTACLLRHDFGVRWWLPPGQLVPPLTNRANYVHWLNDLLHLSAPVGPAGEELPVRGLDIGCGANLIYCLLGAVLYGWHMVGVDVTEVAVRCARRLLADNPQLAPLLEVRDLSALHPELQAGVAALPAGAAEGRRGAGRGGRGGGRGTKRRRSDGAGEEGGQGEQEAEHGEDDGAPDGMHAAAEGAGDGEHAAAEGAGDGEHAAAAGAGDGGHEQAPEGGRTEWQQGEPTILLPAFADEEETFAFSMCNPPFFESMQEASRNPSTAFGGTAAEMVCPGGELAFVTQMIDDSERLRERVHWFTTMVGKKDTLKAVRKDLHNRHVTALRTTEFAQGRTSRWGVAWSWQVDPNKALQPLQRVEGPPARGAADEQEAEEEAGEEEAAAEAAPVMPRRYVSFTMQQAGLDVRRVLGRVQAVLGQQGCGGVAVDQAAWSMSWPLQIGHLQAAGVQQQSQATAPKDKQGQKEAPGSSGALTARLRVAQQRRGSMEVIATIPHDAPDVAARAFARLMQAVEQGLRGAPL